MRGLACAVLLAGCSPGVNKCKANTLFVSVTLDPTSRSADQLLVDVVLDGGAPVHTALAHTPGKATGGIEIDFPNRYPTGHTLMVTMTALAAGSSVGAGSATEKLTNGCDAVSLSVTAATSPMDASRSDENPPDLLVPPDGADLSTAQPDAANADLLGNPDLTHFDLTGPCVPAAENCFNQIDDDCDGLVDCADPDCIGGGSPKAVCVPDPGTFTAGVTVAAPTACPSPWPTATTVHSALIPGSCGLGTCTCGLFGNYCWGYFLDVGPSSNAQCAGGSGTLLSMDTARGCSPLTVPAGHWYDLLYNGWGGGCQPGSSDAATVQPPAWGATDRFCSGATVGGGCGGGMICVPAGPNHCVIKLGSQVACPPNYTLRPTKYYSDFDDSARSCDCTCSISNAPTCTGTPTFTLSDSSDCGGSTFSTGPFVACTNDDLSSYHYAKLTGVSVATGGTCSAPGTQETGTTVLNGERTICCTP